MSKVEEVLATHDKVEEILANLSKIEERSGDIGISAVTKMPGLPHDGDFSAFLVTKVPLFNEWRFAGDGDDGALGIGGSDVLMSWRQSERMDGNGRQVPGARFLVSEVE